MMTERMRQLQRALDKMLAQRAAAMARHDLRGSTAIQAKITALNAQIEEERKYIPRTLAEQLTPGELRRSGLAEKLVELHLAADYLADCGMEIKETLKRLGFAHCTIYPIVDTIRAKAQDFANVVCHPEFAGLQEFMVNNDEIIDTLHERSREYMARKLRLTDDQA